MRRCAAGVQLFAALALLLASCSQESGWTAVQQGISAAYPDVPRVSTDSLAAWLDADSTRPPVLLDVRQAEEYAVSHLPGAIRVDPDGGVPPALDTLARDTPIVAYCSVGYRSSDLASRLVEAGYTNVANLEGSIFRWANEGRAVFRNGHPVREVHPYDSVWGRLLNAELRTWMPEKAASSDDAPREPSR